MSMTPPAPIGTSAFLRKKGIRRVIKVYGQVDPAEQAKREREWELGKRRVLVCDPGADPFAVLMAMSQPVRKPHAGLKTSVKPMHYSPAVEEVNCVLEYKASKQ